MTSPILPSASTSQNNVSIAANFSRAESLLMREERSGALTNIDLLVLPELAFTGYNHSSLSAIAPYLEPTADGPSTRWAARTAKRLKCTVAVGYPEAFEEGNFNTVYDPKISATSETIAYNSLVIVDSVGDVVAHYRKSFLYYTDDTWAKEGIGFGNNISKEDAGDEAVKKMFSPEFRNHSSLNVEACYVEKVVLHFCTTPLRDQSGSLYGVFERYSRPRVPFLAPHGSQTS